MIRAVTLLACLAFAPAAFAAEGGEEPKTQRQERLEAKRAQLEELQEARDAALVRANIYQLPKDKIEAQAKQEEIDALEAEIAALESGG